MKLNSIIAALFGLVVLWKKIKKHKNCLVLIIPLYDQYLTAALPCALSKYLEDNINYKGNVVVVYSDVEVFKRLKNSSYEFIVLKKCEMCFLVNYVNLSSKHYGAMYKRNIKLISLDFLYGGQLRIMQENRLFPLSDLILEKILRRE